MLRTLRSIFVIAISMHLLTGCILINGPTEYANETNAPSINYLPIGIPFVLGGHGSSVPLTEDLSLTAKHVAKLDYSTVVAYHPSCDVAIIKEDNRNKRLAPLGRVSANDNVKTYGIGFSGKAIVGEGKYYLDVNFVDSSLFANCPASIMDAPIQSGMSGGGTFNEKGELVGIISGMSGSSFKLLDGRELGNERTSVFVSTLHIKDWIADSIESYYGLDMDTLIADVPSLTDDFFTNTTPTFNPHP
ncbi:S1 family peptidase [Enterovibrio norvegicus]|uniref:Trypsin-like peptidase domain-containing protein n=1 Tax=Enterovibrio norvegicus DSM 15893 TaxID=1121869 RepID=A0A1I5NAC0_9GAMM|nr:serine protease [Enterovibrio norvegicus]PMH72492.1 hypothetical protein BCU62_02435 [Enterovibrio norvegicus]SFP18640.1 hypothetical protein SAMN03084138_01540 [Enterovibrio norvegicus DSM 15893]